MTSINRKPHAWQRVIQKVVAIKPVTRFFAYFVHRVDKFTLQRNGNRFSPTGALTGLPIAMLTMTGAKTGVQRTLPLVCLHDRDRRVLIASNLGSRSNPGWYYNLCANPNVLLSENNKQGKYTARQATHPERGIYWQQAVNLYAGYKDYQERAGGRIIPIMVLEPDGNSKI